MHHKSPNPRVIWSPEAIRELEQTVKDRSVQEDLKRNAEETMHEIQEPSHEGGEVCNVDEGRFGEIMWCRGWSREQERQAEWESVDPADDGPWNYFLFYRNASGAALFEVLAVRGPGQIADCWHQMNNE